MVSQKHAELLVRGETLWLHDLASTNGTFVNGKQLTGEQQLADGDILHFADLEFKLAQDQEPSHIPAMTIEIKDAMAPGGKLGGLPPMYLSVGGIDTTADDSTRLAERAGREGASVIVDVAAEMVHGYIGLCGAFPEATEAMQRVGDFIRRRIP